MATCDALAEKYDELRDLRADLLADLAANGLELDRVLLEMTKARDEE